jgi:hypothetical protein
MVRDFDFSGPRLIGETAQETDDNHIGGRRVVLHGVDVPFMAVMSR